MVLIDTMGLVGALVTYAAEPSRGALRFSHFHSERSSVSHQIEASDSQALRRVTATLVAMNASLNLMIKPTSCFSRA